MDYTILLLLENEPSPGQICVSINQHDNMFDIIHKAINGYTQCLLCQIELYNESNKPVFTLNDIKGNTLIVKVKDLVDVLYVPLDELLQTNLIESKWSWINYDSEYSLFELWKIDKGKPSCTYHYGFTIDTLPTKNSTLTYKHRLDRLKRHLQPI